MAPRSPPVHRSQLPQPVEETTKAHRINPPTKDQSSEAGGSPSRQLSTSTSPEENPSLQSKNTSGTSKNESPSDTTAPDLTSNKQPSPRSMESHLQSPSSNPRKFAPQMIETSRRSRKSTDTSPCVTPTDKTDVSPEHLPGPHPQQRPLPIPVPPVNTPLVSSEHVPQVPESKFSSFKLAERQDRRHSFRVPDLPAIPSTSGDESNASSGSSLPTTPSARSGEAEISNRKRKSRAEENQDDQWSGYLLSLAAKNAEKQLREQAMAAYPNEHMHEPVDHYAVDRDSEDDSEVEEGVGKLRLDGPKGEAADRKPAGHRHRESAAGWDMAEMRMHQDKLEQQKASQRAVDPAELGRRRSTRKALQEAENARKAAEDVGAPPKNIIGWQKDNEMKPMRNAASPPMAGENLKFPKCLSPQATRLDVHQYPGSTRHHGIEARQHTGLWTPRGGASRANSGSGLWNGVCNAHHQEPIKIPKQLQSGLLTPAPDRSDPFIDDSYNANQLPPSPPSSQDSKIDYNLRRELSLEAEFDDTFITQVYNYLSLGYPSLARKYDEELSKIARVSIDDLRKDDSNGNSRGYVGAPEGTGSDPRGVMEGDTKCERWCALRKYVREWARQQPGMDAANDPDNGWGARARKGSWAI